MFTKRVPLRQLLPAFIFVLILASAGCTSVRLVAEYDKRIDDEITALQKKTEVFLNGMERTADTPEGSYGKNVHFYDTIKADVNVLVVRSEALSLNRLTMQQLQLLGESITALEEQHRKGLTRHMIEPVRRAFQAHYAAILTLEVAKKTSNR
ncbi:MAG: hypothetical protein WA610_10205 [Thermodesulfovibrionales bacterium]